MLSLNEVKGYLRVDFEDDDAFIETLIIVADEYLKSAIGETYNKNSERAKILSLIVIQDLYDNKGITEKIGGNVRKLINDFSLQLKLESGV